MGMKAHKAAAPKSLKLAIISVSSSRTIKEDASGHWIRKRAIKEGHDVLIHRVIPDDKVMIAVAVSVAVNQYHAQVVIITGGTGISRADVTIEAVRPLFEKELTAFASVFAQLSFEDIDSSAIMSRAAAGIIGKTAVFCIPGSLKACKLACKALIFPEMGHVIKHVYDE
jgi:molybdenum cofactor biosynthesis protein B